MGRRGKVAITENLVRIEQILMGKSKDITQEEERHVERLKKADQLIGVYGPGATVAKMLVAEFRKDGFKYTESWAYIDQMHAQAVMGSMYVFERSFWKNKMAEKILADIAYIDKRLQIEKADEEGHTEHKKLEALLKTKQGLYKELRETIGYGLEEDKLPDYSSLQPPMVQIVYNPDAIEAEDVDHEEIEEKLREYGIE